MAIRSLSQIITDAIAFIASKKPNIATFVGTVTRDVVIESPAQEFDEVYTELSHTQKLQSLTYATEMTDLELDALANNYNMSRLGGTQATGTVTFQIRNFSISSAIVTIPVGTVVSTIGSSSIPQVTFATTSPLTFQPANAPTYFNPTTGLYEQTTTILAQAIGVSGNVAAGTITRLISPVTGIDRVVNNVATTGGTDIEDNAAFAERIQIKLSGNNIGTPNGIISLMKTNSNVTDAIVVTANDPEMLRSEFGGEVDVYILGTRLSTLFDLNVYSVTGDQTFLLQHQPVLAVSSITGIVGSAPYTFIAGTDYSFNKDLSALYTGSSREASTITFLGATVPDDNTQITITYTYDALVEDLQLLLDRDDAHIVASDILVRLANEATVDITADITMFPGFNSSDVISAVQTALSEFINTLGLGKSINRSDIIGIIEDVDGVDAVDVDSLIMEKNNVPIGPTTQKLTIFKTEYAQVGTLTITVV